MLQKIAGRSVKSTVNDVVGPNNPIVNGGFKHTLLAIKDGMLHAD